MLASLLDQLIAINLFELGGLISGLLCVWLLIRQSIWTWPIGLLYTIISLYVFFEAKLYSEFGLHIYYAMMNAYGWFYWSRVNAANQTSNPIQQVNKKTFITLIIIALMCIPALAETMQQFTDVESPYPDSTITILSFIAMWMTARKLIESWLLWLLIDVLATALYIQKGIELYAVLYGVYIIMAVLGWRAWQLSLKSDLSNAQPLLD